MTWSGFACLAPWICAVCCHLNTEQVSDTRLEVQNCARPKLTEHAAPLSLCWSIPMWCALLRTQVKKTHLPFKDMHPWNQLGSLFSSTSTFQLTPLRSLCPPLGLLWAALVSCLSPWNCKGTNTRDHPWMTPSDHISHVLFLCFVLFCFFQHLLSSRHGLQRPQKSTPPSPPSARVCWRSAGADRRKTLPTVAAERRLEECNYTKAAAYCKTCRHGLVRAPTSLSLSLSVSLSLHAIVLWDLSGLVSACGPDASFFHVPLSLPSRLRGGEHMEDETPRLASPRLASTFLLSVCFSFSRSGADRHVWMSPPPLFFVVVLNNDSTLTLHHRRPRDFFPPR